MKLQKKILAIVMTACICAPTSLFIGARAATSSCVKKSTYPERSDYSNTSDTPFGIDFNGADCNTWPAKNSNSTIASTPNRAKYHDCSMYVYVKSVFNNGASRSNIRISTTSAGRYSSNGANGCDEGSAIDGYNQHYRYINVGTEYLLYNYVLEDARREQYITDGRGTYGCANGQNSNGTYYYTYAGLKFKFSNVSADNYVKGYWSPDAVQTNTTRYAWGSFE